MQSWEETQFSWAKSLSFPLSGANLFTKWHNYQAGGNLVIIPFCRQRNWNHRSYTQVPSQFTVPPIFSFLISQTSVFMRITWRGLLKDCWALFRVHPQVWGRSLEYAFFFFFFFKSPATAGPGTTLARITALCLVLTKGLQLGFPSSATNQLWPWTGYYFKGISELQDSMTFVYFPFIAILFIHFSLITPHIESENKKGQDWLSPDFSSSKTPLSGSFGDNAEENECLEISWCH